MVRRTKEEALVTRHTLLDAAEHLFQAQGVSRTSLQDIARRAGATRGAVYWHFKDKADLFNAMMERVTLPLEQSFQNQLGHEEQEGQEEAPRGYADPLARIRNGVAAALLRIASDPQTRRVFEVATHKVEYVGELQALRLRHLKSRSDFVAQVERGLQAAARHHARELPVPAAAAAQGLHAIIDGLIQSWLLESADFDLVSLGRDVVEVYLRGLGFPGTGKDGAAPS
ncbi:MAG: TetR family transcriptional regulator [Polaromonas sp.]|uniref:TetR family transcriptional regulator n=1 Tax=Polaromonas sp. TaxID=1869339 RepID=UPI0027277458|nr:TetR family transcriptional regulator [Polaromonas sp.]MDO9113788.1 TetR family transcriptional regulator [Polaromonas sp.]MDP1887151.1 TetR family transcriptional regulator [Polaromonas sp.]